MLAVVRNGPGAVKLDKEWSKGIPNDAAGQQRVLADDYGYQDQILGHMKLQKPRRGLASMLRHNLDPDQSKIGIGTKALVGMVYASYVGNDYLARRAAELAEHHGVSPADIEAGRGFFPGSSKAEAFDERTTAALSVARLISPSPAVIDSETVALAGATLTSEEIVEVAVWVSVSQLLHRLSVYYDVGSAD